jgi:hypothetical protein
LRNTAIVAAKAQTVKPELPDVLADVNHRKIRVHCGKRVTTWEKAGG